MKFFKPEDFQLLEGDYYAGVSLSLAEQMAARANAKLECEGRVVYSGGIAGEYGPFENNSKKYKALIINIEPIEHCKHPLSKCSYVIREEINNYEESLALRCLCGAILIPETYKEIK